MKIEEKFILSSSELKSMIQSGINAGLSMGESTVFKNEPTYKKVDIAFENFLETMPTKTKLMFEVE